MGLLNRFSSVLKANVNSVLDKFSDSEKMLNQKIEDMRDQIIKVKRETANAITSEYKLVRKCEEARKSVELWDKRVNEALDRGESDDILKKGLAQRADAEDMAEAYGDQRDKQSKGVAELRSGLERLELKFDELVQNKELLVARKNRAEAQVTINETLAGIDDSADGFTLERAEEDVDELEARANATADMAELAKEDEFAAFEKKRDLDSDLALLKASRTVEDTSV